MKKEGSRNVEHSAEYNEAAGTEGDKRINDELNKMGSMEDIAVQSIVAEEAEKDVEAAKASEVELGREIKEINDSISFIDDITENGDLDLWMSLRSINEILTDSKEVKELADMLVEKGSERFKNQTDIRTFRAMLQTWLDRGTFKSDTTLGQAVNVLLAKKEKDEDLIKRKNEIINRPSAI